MELVNPDRSTGDESRRGRLAAPYDSLSTRIGRPFLTALLTLDAQAAAEWAEREHRAFDMDALTDDPDLQAKVEQAVERTNGEHSHGNGRMAGTRMPRASAGGASCHTTSRWLEAS